MAIFLNILLAIVSVGIFSGRLYELINLIDHETNFLIIKGLIFNPYILPIFIVIIICCGVVILGDIKKGKVFFAKAAGVFSIFAGVSFLAYVVISLASGGIESSYSLSLLLLVTLLGAIGLIIVGITGLKGKKYEMIAVALITAFCVGLCLNAIIFDVSTIYDIAFLKNSLAALSVSLFFLMVFKNVYSPSRSSIMWLYVAGFICFTLCGIMSMADIAYGYISGTISTNSLFLYAGYVFIGLYAVSTSLLTIPNGKIEIVIKDCEPDAWNSIKMLEQTQELKVQPKQRLNPVAQQEMEFKTHHQTRDGKTSVYNLPAQHIASEQEEPVTPKRRIFESKFYKAESKKETDKPIKSSSSQKFKSVNTEKTNSTAKIVYKKPQD